MEDDPINITPIDEIVTAITTEAIKVMADRLATAQANTKCHRSRAFMQELLNQRMAEAMSIITRPI